MASYSFFQLIFSPILGRISDINGRKIILIVSIVGSIVSYLMWSVSQNYIFFLISRTISGATGASLSVVQSYIADITSANERAKYVGIVGATLGIGPFFGDLLSAINISQVTNSWINYNRFDAIGIFTAGISL